MMAPNEARIRLLDLAIEHVDDLCRGLYTSAEREHAGAAANEPRMLSSAAGWSSPVPLMVLAMRTPMGRVTVWCALNRDDRVHLVHHPLARQKKARRKQNVVA